MTHIKAPTLFPRGIIIFQGVLTKFNFWRNFHISKKIVNLMKALKYEHQSILPLWARVKLNFRDRYGKPNIYFNDSSCYQFFSSNSQKLSLWCKKKIIPHPYGFVWPIYGPLHYSLGYYNLPRSTNKIQFFDEISISRKKIVNFMKYIKYKHQSIFPMWGRVKVSFRDRYEKPNNYSKNSSCCQVFFYRIVKKWLWHNSTDNDPPLNSCYQL